PPLPPPPPETVETLHKERAKLIVQVSALEQSVADLRTRLERVTKGPLPDPLLPGAAPPAKPKVLLVEDREENLAGPQALIVAVNGVSVRAGSGPEALQRLLEDDFALVLLDVLMPGMDGFETATLVHRRKRSSATPIVFLTAHGDDPALILRGYNAGAADYMPKPLVPEVRPGQVAIFPHPHETPHLRRRQSPAPTARRAAP